MKIYLLTDDWNNPGFINAVDTFLDNGHTMAPTLTEADLILVGPDITSKEFNLIKGKQVPKIVEFITYQNWITRTFII